MSFIKDFLKELIGVEFEEKDDPTCYRKPTKDPLILSLRKIPREEMEEPEVEYIPIQVDSDVNEVVDCEVLP
jgi:hypothetical protein